MALPISSLYVELAANTAKLQKDLGKATRMMQASTAKWEKSIGGVTRSLGAMAAAIGAGAVSDSIKEMTEWSNTLDTTARRIGLTTDRLQALRIEGEKYGMDVQGTDDALQEFALRLDEARTGSGSLKDVLEELRIEIKDTDGNFKSVTVVLDEYVNALKSIEDPARRVRLGDQAMEGEAVKLNQAFAEMNGTIDENIERLKTLGQIIDDDVIDSTAELDTKWRSLTRTMETTMKKAVLGVVSTLFQLQEAMRPTSGGVLGWFTSLVMTQAELDEFERLAVEAADKAAKILRDLASGSSIGVSPPYTGAKDKKTSKPVENIKSITTAGETLAQQMESVRQALDGAYASEVQFTETLRVLDAALAESQLGEKQIITLDEYNALLLLANQRLEDFLDSNQDIAVAFDDSDLDGRLGRIANEADRFANVFGSAMSAAIVNGDKFGDVLKSIERDLLDVITQLLVVNPLKDAISGGLQGSGLFQAFATAFQPAAMGANTLAGQNFLVGERGPELFRAPSSGAIVPNSSMGAINITINQTGGAGSDYRSAQQLASVVGDRVNRAVARNR